MSLPPQYSNDAMFRSSHGVTRDQMLAEAESSYNKAQNADPFEMDDTEISGTLNDGQIRDMSEALKAESGKRMMKHLLGKQSAEESKKSLDVTRDAFRRGKDHILMQEHKDLDQLQAWDKDLCTWTYKDENLKELHQTSKTNKRQRGKIEFHRHARDLWEKGFTTHSGGEVQRRQDITDQDLLKGRKEKISEKHSQSKYFTDLAFFMEDGREMKIGRMLSRVVKQSMDKYIPIMLQDIAANMGLSNSAASGFIKSNKAEANVKEFLLQTGIVDKELEEIPTSA